MSSATIVRTVERGTQVLRAFRAERAPLSNAELVRRTQLSKATVSRLTTTLLQLGFIKHVPGGREFELATGGFAIGHAMIGASELTCAAEPFLEELADALGVSAALATADELDMLYVAYRASPRVVGLRMGVGSVLPMGTTAAGHAYLWSLAAQERASLLNGVLANAGTRRDDMAAQIAKSFEQLRDSGTCAVLGTFQRDAYAIALPVRVGRQCVRMTLSCGKADVQPDLARECSRIAPLLRSMATRVEQSLCEIDAFGFTRHLKEKREG